MKRVGERIADVDAALRTIEEHLNSIALRIPNLPHSSVPLGRGADDNLEIRRWGQLPAVTMPAKSHCDIGEYLGILDFDRAAKIAGARFAVLTGAGARLERALINFMANQRPLTEPEVLFVKRYCQELLQKISGPPKPPE